jgi:glycosyltransferase involved in cell wall biosynthesis
MQRDPALLESGRVVHVVGRVTDEVFSFLGPATHALACTGREQVVVMIDELRHRHHVVGLHASAELMVVPSLRNPIRQWSAVRKACRAAAQAGPLHAVHLHGFLPGLVGAQLMRKRGAGVPLFFSPHGSRAIGTLRGPGQLALLLVRALLPTSRIAAIVNVPRETQAFSNWKSAELVESPVGEVFFAVPRNDARHPLVVTGGRSQGVRNVELLTQLAVLLSGEDLRISFNWIGTVDSVSRVRLSAAGVGVFDVVDDAERASRLAAGWIYLAPGGTRGFPLFLVEAMAAGLPCVALDCVQHREVIRDGESGYLCASEHEMIERMAALIDDPALRSKLGQNARADARRRFAPNGFARKLMAAYAVHQETIESLMERTHR